MKFIENIIIIGSIENVDFNEQKNVFLDGWED